MAVQTNGLIWHLRKIGLLLDDAGMPDGQLLKSFLAQRDETAFAALMRRHGPMPRCLPSHSSEFSRCRGRFPGHFPRFGPQGKVNWPAGIARQLALRCGLPNGPGGARSRSQTAAQGA